MGSGQQKMNFSLSSTIVRLIPSMATEPFLIIIFVSSSLTETHTMDWLVSLSAPILLITPISSTCPVTKCPPSLPPTLNDLSIFTLSEILRLPIVVLLNVSLETSKKTLLYPLSVLQSDRPRL